MTKKLLVASALQATLLTQFLVNEIQTGFWKQQRPSTHGAAWNDVEIVVTSTNQVGPVDGFAPMRFYDFLNPEFTKQYENKLVEIARTVKPSMTFKALKKELIELARIIGGRMTDKTQEPARVFRGNNRSDYDVIRTVERQKVVSVANAQASVKSAIATVKKTVVKKTSSPVEVSTDGITVSKTTAGATVRKVAAKTVSSV